MTARVFLAGASGVLGRRVVPALLNAGRSVTANVRDDAARRRAEEAGATTCTVDLFDADAVVTATAGHDVVVNIATSIPTGMAAARPSNWAMNDRLRAEASANLAAGALAHGASYVGESITFPYVDSAERWIDEDTERTHVGGFESTLPAEEAAARVAAAGFGGVTLRFAMFNANDSAHTQQLIAFAKRGVLGLPGQRDGFTSFIDLDDAARAVVAALDVASGVYNVAEPNPTKRARHAEALALVFGRRRVRSVPAVVTRMAGDSLAPLARSQRVSSQRLSDASAWEPRVDVVRAWPNMS
jgi:NAD dependent epimerase/dehydratase family enzyme